ncbi:MAG TPA: SRPBCC domain-containing protein, partial [Acidimicrobiia bacterium]|nr:SRPBCC domain-containing protein [Acidimicrobiia bacterium]
MNPGPVDYLLDAERTPSSLAEFEERSTQHRLTNASTPEEVWARLMDFDSYPEWNPFVREISGNPAVGAQLNVRLQNPGGKAMTFTPIVTSAESPNRFSWLGKLGFKGAFDGHHRFDVESTGNGTVLFTQREEFSGAFVPILW